jgi:integrating conjugative element protein (TIGR03757 family)
MSLRSHCPPAILERLVVCLIPLLTSAVAIADVLITTDQYLIATTENIQTINLDLPSILEAKLSNALPATSSEAQAIVSQRLTPELTAKLTQAHQDITEAWSMGITKVPAVVVDRKYVVYGETNVQRALDRIEVYRRAEQ